MFSDLRESGRCMSITFRGLEWGVQREREREEEKDIKRERESESPRGFERERERGHSETETESVFSERRESGRCMSITFGGWAFRSRQ